jgi:hypothetical protein
MCYEMGSSAALAVKGTGGLELVILKRSILAQVPTTGLFGSVRYLIENLILKIGQADAFNPIIWGENSSSF